MFSHMSPMINAYYHKQLEPLHYVQLETIKEFTIILVSSQEELTAQIGQAFPCLQMS